MYFFLPMAPGVQTLRHIAGKLGFGTRADAGNILVETGKHRVAALDIGLHVPCAEVFQDGHKLLHR